MKKLLLLALFALPLLAFCQNTRKLDEKYGFQEYIFGTSPKEHPSLKQHSLVDFMYFTTDGKTIGEIPISSITLKYHKDRLYSISFETKYGILVRQVFEEAYGKGHQENRYIKKYVWSAKKVVLTYDENEITDITKIDLFDIKLLDEVLKARKEDAKNKVKDL